MTANPISSAPLRPRLAEAPLIGNGALYRLLVEESPDPLFLIDLETEVCAYASPAVRRLLGRDPGEIVGRRLTTLIHPDDVREALARSRRRREGRGVRTALSRMLHADRHWVWVQSRASSTLVCAGRTVAVFSVSGASERARAEVGLRSTRTRMRSLLARLGEGGDLQQTRDGTYDRAVEALAAALELRDDESFQHARRVTELALELTAMVEPELAADPELRFAYLLHDIGKIGVPDTILLKRGPLTERELRVV
jgi:PAS domain S-box-containing protein